MAWWWIFRMGYSKRSGDGQPQTVYRFNRDGRPEERMLQADNGSKPHYATLWTESSASDPWGYDDGMTPDDLVGRYGNWWGAQWSGGRVCGYDGVGPTDCPYVDALDRVALEHDIECWIAGEVNRNPKLGIRSGDMFHIQQVYWEGSVGPRDYVYTDQLAPHMHARQKIRSVPIELRQRLKAAIYLYTLLYVPVTENETADQLLTMQQLNAVEKAATMRGDWGCAAAIEGIGLDDISIVPADLFRILKNPRSYNIPLSAGDVQRITARLKMLPTTTDPVLRGLAASMH